MAVTIRASEIKYTIMALEIHEIDCAIEMVKNYLADAPRHRLAVASAANGIHGFVCDGLFWHPRVSATTDWITGLDKDLRYIIIEAHPIEATACDGTLHQVTGYDYSSEPIAYDVCRSATGVVYAIIN